MKLALSLASRGLGQVWPNPAVGCVIVKDGRIVGRGRTAAGGRPHAETEALLQAGAQAPGATAYVSLEPCAHHGQTPPCANALVSAGIARVVTATGDPDPRVAGQGHAILRNAGVKVETGLLEPEARDLNQGFLLRVQQGRPLVTLKLASSFDGRIATASGESQWITGGDARRLVHLMRARHDSVMIGAGTARADDPALTVRGLGIDCQPVRVIVSGNLDLPSDGKLAGTARDVPLWLIHGAGADQKRIEAWQSLGANTINTGEDGTPSIGKVLHALGDAGLTRVFCEGGSAFAASLLNAGMVDRLVGFTAGCVIGAEGLPAIGPLGLSALKDAPRFELVSVERIGADLVHHWAKER